MPGHGAGGAGGAVRAQPPAGAAQPEVNVTKNEQAELFWRRHYRRLVWVFTSWGANPADAEDLAQEALWETIRRPETPDCPDAYLAEVARNKMAGWMKARGRQEAAVRAVARWPGQYGFCDTHPRIEAGWDLARMLTLPPRQRAVVALRYDGLTDQEVAKVLGIREATVRAHRRDARSKLKSEVWDQPGSELYRKVLTQAYKELRAGNSAPPGVRPLIRASWQRSEENGVDPDSGTLVGELSPTEVADRLSAHTLKEFCDNGCGGLAHLAGTHGLMLAIADADGTVLLRLGDPAALKRAADVGLRDGSQWNEHTIGSSAISIALEATCPVHVHPLEHFATSQQGLQCAAAPVLGHHGKVLAAVNLTGPPHAAHPRMLECVTKTANQLTSWLQRATPAPRRERERRPSHRAT
jgi:DNA-directed RNA polymerase specialized sigma24 family protein